MSDRGLEGWVALVRCPLCLREHRVLWPSRWPPTPAQRMEVGCPERAGLLVVRSDQVWAEWRGTGTAEEPAPLVAAERFV